MNVDNPNPSVNIFGFENKNTPGQSALTQGVPGSAPKTRLV